MEELEKFTHEKFEQFKDELLGGFGLKVVHFNGRTASDVAGLHLIAKAEGLSVEDAPADEVEAPEGSSTGGEVALTPQQKAVATKAAKKAAESQNPDPAGDPDKIKADAKAAAEKAVEDGQVALTTAEDADKPAIQAAIEKAQAALKELG